jgi:hypothetical protein
MRSLHDVLEMKAGLVVRLSVCTIKLGKCWTDLNWILFAHLATGDYPKIMLYGFSKEVIPTWSENKLARLDRQ